MVDICVLRGAFIVDEGRYGRGVVGALEDRARNAAMAAAARDAAEVVDAVALVSAMDREWLRAAVKRDGGRFPSLRDLGRKFGVSHETARCRVNAALGALDRAISESKRRGLPEGMVW